MEDNETAASAAASTFFPPRPPECGNFEDVAAFRFWFDGVLVSVIAVVGFVGNLLALIVLSRPKLRDVFHQLLFALACFDMTFLVCGGVNYTFRAFKAQSDVFTYLFPYLIYPMTHVAIGGTIMMTVAISLERYLGLCHPMLPLHTRKAWFYILPVVVMSFALNAPKFLEVQLNIEEVNGTRHISYGTTDLRFDETYIRAYIMWTRLFSTAVIPVALLLYFNSRIFVDLLNSKVQRFGSARRQRREFNLCLVLLSIVLVFFLCHTTRIVLDVHEFSNLELIIACPGIGPLHWPWLPAYWGQVMPYISHTLMMLNSSGNFAIYCLVGHTFRRELLRTFGIARLRGIPPSFTATFASTAVAVGGTEGAAETTLITRASINGNGSGGGGGLTVTNGGGGRLLKKRKSSSEEGEEAGDRELGVGLLGSRGEAEGKN